MIQTKIILITAQLSLLTLAGCTGRKPEKAISENIAKAKSLKQQLEEIVHSKHADIGLAVMHFEDGDTLSINGDKPYVMMSVVKFPLALAILREVDRGHFRLDQNVHFDKSEIKEDTHSPMRDDHKGKKELNLPLSRVLEYSVSLSDNNACDKLFQMLGGAAATSDSLYSMGADGIHLSYNYAHMRVDSLIGNNSTPLGMLHMLELFYANKLLSESSNKFLMNMMEHTASGPNRIRGLLPEGTVVAHKTGTYFTDDHKIIEAYNDAGMVTLPNGKHFAIVVFVNNSTEKEEKTAAIIAELTKACWDHYSHK